MWAYTEKTTSQRIVRFGTSSHLVRAYHQVQQGQDGDEAEIDLADHLLPGILGIVLVKVGLFCRKTNVRILVRADFNVVNLLEIFLHRVRRCSVGGLWRHGEYQADSWWY
jgi:hypothetical protein